MILQNICFPSEEKLERHWELFYRAQRLFVADHQALHIPKWNTVDFATWANGFPLSRWKRYTNLNNLTLTLDIEGECDLVLTGYSSEPNDPVRRDLGHLHIAHAKRGCISAAFPVSSLDHGDFIAFEIIPHSDCILFGGYFSSDFPDSAVREVNLAASTTTFRKEDFITRNLTLIKRDIFEAEDDMKDHFYFIVVDNGRTLDAEAVSGDHIRLLPNKNVGGAGGFARGMIEALHMETENITHILLMDDDILLLPESIRRIYTLLRLVTEPYVDAFVSGAMLNLDNMYLMHEDVGFVLPSKDFLAIKPQLRVNKLKNILKANAFEPSMPRSYAGWWCCCIPMKFIRAQGLPLPLFFRGDDAEYGIRCAPEFISMTGIGVWHQSFDGKFSATTNLYQEFRNMFIVRAAGGKIPEVDVLGRLKMEILRCMLTFSYDSFELLLLALEEYLEGPSFIREERGEELLKRNRSMEDKMLPLEHFVSEVPILLKGWETDAAASFIGRIWYYLTLNGQRPWSDKVRRPGVSVIPYDYNHQPGKTMGRNKLLVINPYDRTGCYHTKDKKRFQTLYKRYKKDLKDYKNRHAQVENEYRKSYATFISEEFWRNYLEIDESGTLLTDA